MDLKTKLMCKVILLILCGTGASASGPSTEKDSENITTAWSHRLKSFKSLEFSFTTRRFDVEGISPNSKPRNEKDMNQTSYEQSTRILLAGDRVRYELDGDNPGVEGTLYKHRSVDTFDGKTSKHLDLSKHLFHYPTGMIYKRTANRFVDMADTLPFRWAFGPPNALGFDLSKLKFEGTGTIDERRCLIFRSGSSDCYWMDPSKAYSILRYTVGTEGNVEFQLDCSYKKDPSGLWVPAAWKMAHFARGNAVRSSATGEVRTYRMDPMVSDDDFDIVFPVGAVVTDVRPHPEIGYIVTPDGGKRIIAPNESSATYEELLATPSGTAKSSFPAGKKSSSALYITVNLVLVVFLAVFIGLRIWYKKRYAA